MVRLAKNGLIWLRSSGAASRCSSVRHDHAAPDLAGLDHGGEDRETVEKAEAGVGHIKDLRSLREADLPMGKCRGGGLQHVTADGRVHERLDLLRRQ